MIVVRDYPPLFDEIDAKFRVRGKRGVIFSWGDRIYNPHGVDIPPALMVHEQVHGARQLGDVEGWWRRYIDDVVFRFNEELLAHQAEYDAMCEAARDRRERRWALKVVANRLAGGLYGSMITKDVARQLLRADREET